MSGSSAFESHTYDPHAAEKNQWNQIGGFGQSYTLTKEEKISKK